MSESHDDQRADRRAHVLLELDRARARRRASGLTVRLPRSLPVPDRTAADPEPAPVP